MIFNKTKDQIKIKTMKIKVLHNTNVHISHLNPIVIVIQFEKQ